MVKAQVAAVMKKQVQFAATTTNNEGEQEDTKPAATGTQATVGNIGHPALQKQKIKKNGNRG